MERFKAARLKEVSPSKVDIDFACLKAFFEKAVDQPPVVMPISELDLTLQGLAS